MATQAQNERPRKLIRRPAVEEMTGLGRSEIYDRMRRGIFPTPIRIGKRAVAWDSREVDDWIEHRIAESRESA